MTLVVAAIVVLGGLVALNLLLTFGIVRRLRTYESERSQGHGMSEKAPGLPLGAEVSAFTAETTQGRKVTAEDLSGERTLVGFFSTDCGVCLPRVPSFVAAVRDRSAETTRALAVIKSGDEDPAELLAALKDDVEVVLHTGPGGIGSAFAADAFPWFYLVGPDATILGSGYEVEQCLTEPARV
ncbi:TlpA family protein disulfide reductase [Actinomadura sp. HBU206391]|uniref:TlpA family protein disulfide reductase n=1 Tax=Actinomadura sp. HBU206391 TaxID=2731692 RepID=UPI00164EED43|nr:redoxin domain-containing protein [Actinomadura sp. HBU206391]MBC6459168.1 redoxin domain-containing protein [Actinomadura sp. HBU206391]